MRYVLIAILIGISNLSLAHKLNPKDYLKYELIQEDFIVLPNGKHLHRIKALKSFGIIEKGDLGGYIEAEKNLSHFGNAWVFKKTKIYGNAGISGNAIIDGTAHIFGNARVSGNAMVYGNAKVYGDAWVFGDARVSGNAKVYGDARVSGDTSLKYEKHTSIYDGTVLCNQLNLFCKKENR
jgi:hypothetical protein